VEDQLAAGLGERQVAELVEHDEVEPGQVIGDGPLRDNGDRRGTEGCVRGSTSTAARASDHRRRMARADAGTQALRRCQARSKMQ
jgi:hypothetical protein